MSKRRKNQNKQSPKKRNFNNIEEIINEFLINKILNNRINKKSYRNQYFTLKSAKASGPFIKKDKRRNIPVKNWITWAFENHEIFLDVFDKILTSRGMNYENFTIDIQETQVIITETDPDTIPGRAEKEEYFYKSVGSTS